MGNIEALTRTAADAASDIQRLQSAVLTDDNVRALRQAVLTICKWVHVCAQRAVCFRASRVPPTADSG